MLQRDVTVDVPGGNPRVTIINRCQIITTYHDLAVGLAFFLVPKKFGYDCSSQSRRRLPAEAASLRPCTSTAAPRCTMLQRDVTVDVPGGDPRVTIINRCQIITTYHDLAVGLAFFLVPKKFGYDCSSQSRRRLPAEAASLRPCTSTAAPRCTMLQRDVTVDVPGGDPRVTIITVNAAKSSRHITTWLWASLSSWFQKVWIWLFFTVPEASSCRSSFFQHRTARCYRRCLYSATCIPEPPLSKSNLSVLPGDPCKRGGTSCPLGSSRPPSSTLMYFASFSSAAWSSDKPSARCQAVWIVPGNALMVWNCFALPASSAPYSGALGSWLQYPIFAVDLSILSVNCRRVQFETNSAHSSFHSVEPKKQACPWLVIVLLCTVVRCHASCFKNWEIAQPLQAQPVRDPSGPEIRRANKFEHKIQLLCTHDIYSRKKPSSKGGKKTAKRRMVRVRVEPRGKEWTDIQ